LEYQQNEPILQMDLEVSTIKVNLHTMLLKIFTFLLLKLESNSTSVGCIYRNKMCILATFLQICIENPLGEPFHGQFNKALQGCLSLSASELLQNVLFTLTPNGQEIEITR
jgi:hypothetical protein